MFKKKIKVPITLEEFDSLMDKMVEKYKFTDKRHVAAVVSVAIRHLPNDQAFTTMDYLAQSVWKNIANGVANYKGQEAQHSAQIQVLADKVAADPNDNQARDELKKMSDQGSVQAKAALEKIDAKENGAILKAVPDVTA